MDKNPQIGVPNGSHSVSLYRRKRGTRKKRREFSMAVYVTGMVLVTMLLLMVSYISQQRHEQDTDMYRSALENKAEEYAGAARNIQLLQDENVALRQQSGSDTERIDTLERELDEMRSMYDALEYRYDAQLNTSGADYDSMYNELRALEDQLSAVNGLTTLWAYYVENENGMCREIITAMESDGRYSLLKPDQQQRFDNIKRNIGMG